MARPKKATVDYFPHYTDHGKTLFILESRWGNDGYAAWFKILEMLGLSDGQFIDCREQYSWQHLVAFTRVDEATLKEILDILSVLGKIDRELWTHGIIYCQKFVDGITDAYRKRSNSLPSRAKVIAASNVQVTGYPPPITPTLGFSDDGSTEREREREREKIKNLSPSDDEDISGNELGVDYYLTKKKRKLSGKRLDTFLTFWEAFDYKTGKAEAADSWLDIPSMSLSLVTVIVDAAKAEARSRSDTIRQGKTPKMAQGWLTGRRWEDEAVGAKQSRRGLTDDFKEDFLSCG